MMIVIAYKENKFIFLLFKMINEPHAIMQFVNTNWQELCYLIIK